MQYMSLALEDEIAVITLNRQDRLNALSPDVVKEFGEVVSQLTVEDQARVIIITGQGKAFSAGEDVKDIVSHLATRIGARECFLARHRFLKYIAEIEQVVICAVNGYCIGLGMGLALYSDLILASEDASFSAPELRFGTNLNYGVVPRLVQLVGWLKAKELLFTGATIGAQEALALGLVNRVVAPERLLDEAKLLARRVVEAAPSAVRVTKAYINAMLSINLADASVFDHYIGAGYVKEDMVEGFRAFNEKTPPRFKR